MGDKPRKMASPLNKTLQTHLWLPCSFLVPPRYRWILYLFTCRSVITSFFITTSQRHHHVVTGCTLMNHFHIYFRLVDMLAHSHEWGVQYIHIQYILYIGLRDYTVCMANTAGKSSLFLGVENRKTPLFTTKSWTHLQINYSVVMWDIIYWTHQISVIIEQN